MTSQAPESPAPLRERSPVLRRLVPIAMVALGIVLWRSPLLPQPRTFVWDRPFGLSIVSAEVQLWRRDTLLARAEWPDATQGTLTQQLTLRTGPIRVLSFALLQDGTQRRGTQELMLGSEEVVHAPLLPGDR
ncbi:MAG TPA: hypothetical protein VGK85_05220 [Myxococcaceae bacterium]